MKIKVTPEGRDGIWIPEKESLKQWIHEKNFKTIHNFIANPSGMLLGADHEVDSVLRDIDRCERLALVTGKKFLMQLKHALSLIISNRLEVYDIGEVLPEDLDVE